MKIPIRMTFRLALLIFSLALATASAAEDQTGVLYGDSHACFVTAPSGWVLDNRSGLRNRVHAAFYPEGSSWRDSPAVMYANGVGRSSGETLDSFIADDIQTFRDRSPQIQVKEGPPIKTQDGRIALVRYFSGDQSGNHEAVAYIAEKRAIIVLALTARTQDSYQRSLQSFAELVRNYTFISDDPKNEIHHFDLIQLIADDQSHTLSANSTTGRSQSTSHNGMRRAWMPVSARCQGPIRRPLTCWSESPQVAEWKRYSRGQKPTCPSAWSRP